MFHVKPGDHTSDVRDALSRESIERALGAHGISSTSVQAETLSKHATLVLDANREFNLTRITDAGDVLELHIVDSALATAAVVAAPLGSLVDLGSGPGYPGIVLCVLSGRRTMLVESVGKKSAFLSSAVSQLGIDASVYAGRAEDLARERDSEFACVVARAVAPLASLVELAAPLLILRGRLVALKARPSDEEIASGVRAAAQCGMRQVAAEGIELSEGQTRTLVIYERVGGSRIKLPRRTGLAQHAPLS